MKTLLVIFVLVCFKAHCIKNAKDLNFKTNEFVVEKKDSNSFENRYFYRGISNDSIIKIERINGGFGSLLTDFFLDSTSKELYSGIVVSYFNSYPQDTITVLNGKANGLTKEYRYNIYSGYTFIGYTYVFETNNGRVEVSKYDYYIETNGSFRVNLRYKSKDATSCTYEFDFKKRKINVVKTLNNNKKFRKKFKNNTEIDAFLISENNINTEILKTCKELKVFEENSKVPQF